MIKGKFDSLLLFSYYSFDSVLSKVLWDAFFSICLSPLLKLICRRVAETEKHEDGK